MSWLTDLTNALGLPAGGSVIAAAIYYGCFTIEKEASPQALADISKALKNTSWTAGIQPNEFIERMFRLTFGSRQLSLKCVWRSALLSFLFSGIVSALYLYLMVRGMSLAGRLGMDISPIKKLAQDFLDLGWFVITLFVVVYFTVFAILPDYLSIAKARVVIHNMSRQQGLLRITALVAVDFLLSIVISLFFLILWLGPVIN